MSPLRRKKTTKTLPLYEVMQVNFTKINATLLLLISFYLYLLQLNCNYNIKRTESAADE